MHEQRTRSHSFTQCQFSKEGVGAGSIPAESQGQSGAEKGARRSPRYYYQTEFISRPAKFTWMSQRGGRGLTALSCCWWDAEAQRGGGWITVGAGKEGI